MSNLRSRLKICVLNILYNFRTYLTKRIFFQNLSPPTCLLEFHPLAEYCNAVLSSFNDLRYCNPTSCVLTVTSTLQASLVQVSSNLFSYYEKENVAWLDKEREMFSSLCSCYNGKFLDFIRRCLMVLYEPEKIAKYFGISLSELENEVSVKFAFPNTSSSCRDFKFYTFSVSGDRIFEFERNP